MADIITDGQSLRVTLSDTKQAKTFTLVEGFVGILMQGGSSGDQVVMDISQREIIITVDAGLTANKGDILYMDSNGALTNTSSGNIAVLKVMVAKDANNVVRALKLPQS